METALIFAGLLLLAAASAQQNDEPRPKGVIHGIVVGQDGQPAKRIGLTAEPLGVPLGTKLPQTRTNDAGEYRFENVPWWGRYTVYADDEDAGYSLLSTGPAGDSSPPEVELTPEHPEAELKVLLPPKAGFIQIHLTNRRTGAAISGMRVALMPQKNPASPIFTIRDWSKLQITLERTSCYGRCPAYKVEIHGDGSVVYTGISSVAVTGQHQDRISREALEQIVGAFRRANYFSLANEYVGCAVDCPLYRTSVSIDGQRKSVTDFGGKKVFMPDVVSDLEDSIDRIADTAKWKRGDAATVPALEKEAWDFKSTEAANTLARVAKLGDVDAVRELVVAGVALSGKDEAGRGPLAAAACGDWYIGKGNDDPEAVEARDLRVIPTLLEAGAGRNNPDEMNRALMCAARGRELGPVRLLLQSGASADAADSDGTALIVAASSGVAQLVEEVLKHRPNVNARNQLGKTAIFVAAEHYAWSKDHDINYPDVIRLLAQSFADLNAQDKDGNTALHVALDLERARTLIQLGAGINILNNEGDTPLINTGSGEVAKLLLQAGADPAIRNIHGLTAVDFALAHNWKDKVEALQTAQPEDSTSESATRLCNPSWQFAD